METVVVKNNHNHSAHSNNNNNKQMRTTAKKNNDYRRSFSDKPSPATSVYGYGGLSQYPHRPLISFSYPQTATSLQASQPYNHQYYYPQNPPLLPLPTVPIHQNLSTSLPCRTRNLSCHNIIASPRKSTLQNNPKRQPRPRISFNEEPKKESTKSNPNNNNNIVPSSVVVVGSEIGFVSPPPSSLPLPRFSLRPTGSKLHGGCNAEAAPGIDSCATDNLRRMLQIP